MKYDTKSPATSGKRERQRAQHKMMQHQQYTFLLIAGPTSYSNILNGFNENEILPTGGGKKGE